MAISSYPSLYALGKKEVLDIFDNDVLIEEKIDGSQISFGIIDGKLEIRSKNEMIDLDNPNKMFKIAVDYIKSIQYLLINNWIYRGEFLSKERHNVIRYDRVPKNNIIIYDIENSYKLFHIDYLYKKEVAERIGLETVPLLFNGKFDKFEINKLLNKKSVLGEVNIEGIVIKNYVKLIQNKPMIAKLVSDDFKEVHRHNKKIVKNNKDEFINSIAERYRTKARWHKAIQHLTDDGILTNSVRDIGNIIKEVHADIQKECEDEIKQELFDYFFPKMKQNFIRGFPEYYQEILKMKADE